MRVVCSIMFVCILVFNLFSFAAAGENCAMQGGKCRNACGSDETAEAGAFDDCEEKQECCVVQDTANKINCCVLSFDAKNYGKQNCGSPAGGMCLKGSGSPALCAQLAACKQP